MRIAIFLSFLLCAADALNAQQAAPDACQKGLPQLGAPAIQPKLGAPTRLVIDSTLLTLTASAWLNLQPDPDDTCRAISPLRISFDLVASDSTPLPPGLQIDSAWVIDSTRGFPAPLSTFGAELSDSTRRVGRRIWGGAWWVQRASVFLVVQLRTPQGRRYLLRSQLLPVATVE